MTTKLDDYDEDFVPKIVGVDRNNLEIEVSFISKMVYDYGMFSAHAEDKMDKAKVRWQRKRKEMANSVRSDPGEYGLPEYGRGPSNDQIYEVVDNNREVVELENQYLDAKYLFNRIGAAVEGFQTKRNSLAWALKLWNQNYYADIPVDEKTKRRMLEADHYGEVYEELATIARQKRREHEEG